MTIVYPFRLSRKSDNKPAGQKPIPKKPVREISDSQALQELIDILKKPYISKCYHCHGKGVREVKTLKGITKQACERCNGSGNLKMDLI
ncbi:MAG: hypothetical protein WD601_12570 [Pseudohongiellaceae bacterium]